MSHETTVAVEQRPAIIELLLTANKIKEKDVEKIITIKKKYSVSIEAALIESGFVDAEFITETYAKAFHLDVIHLKDIDPTVIKESSSLLPQKLMRDHRVLPVGLDGHIVKVALVDPSNIDLNQEIRLYLARKVRLLVAPSNEVDQHLSDMFGERDYVKEISQESADDIEVEVAPGDEEEEGEVLDLNRLIPEGKDTKVLRIVNYILRNAAETGTSDIHMEPFSDEAKIRFRIDGVLREITPPPLNLFSAVISRLKILSKMDIAEKRIPQDGAFTLKLDGKEIDMRVSCLPVVWGEKIVMRLLNKSSITIPLSDLGFGEEQYKNFLEGAESENGLIFVTGPTGSGKSTTLYATLNLLKSPAINISTVEDPVEYKLNGINQVQVKHQVGLNFPAALRSFLRQDPDILLVGEVRDQETAEICMKAALTGHLVLSTLHTNDALASISRLTDMGVEPFLIASTLRLVEAQRLIRRLCKECKEPYEVDDQTAEKYGFEPKQTLYKGVGCEACNDLGYKGRVGIFEVVRITPSLADLIQRAAPLPELKAEAAKLGMKDLTACGIEKVQEGLTSLDEILSGH